MPAGRPRKEFSPEELETVRQMASRGLSVKQIGLAVGLKGEDSATCTVYRRPEFRQAYELGRSQGELEIIDALFAAAKSGNVAAMNLYLKCKSGWREAKPSSVEEAIEVLLDAEILPPDLAEASLEVLQGVEAKLQESLSKVINKRKGKSKRG